MKNVVIKYMVAETYSGNMQKYNMLIGVLLFAFLTSFLFLIMPFFYGFVFLADLFLVIAGVIGLYFTFKYRKESQPHIKTGVIVGVTGSVLSLLLISFFVWILVSLDLGFDFILFLRYILSFFGVYGILYVLVGIILGYLMGNYYRKRENVGKESPLL